MSENIQISVEDSLKDELVKLCIKIKENLDLVVENYKEIMTGSEDDVKKIEFYSQEINKYKVYIDEKILKFFEESSNRLRFDINGKTFLTVLTKICKDRNFMLERNNHLSIVSMDYVLECLDDLIDDFYTFRFLIKNEEESEKLVTGLKSKIQEVEQNVINLNAAKEALENLETEKIFSKASKKFLNTARFYDVLLVLMFYAIYKATNSIYNEYHALSELLRGSKENLAENFEIYFQNSKVYFFITKILIVSIAITLATIFIRRASHYRKLHDQSHQKSLELQALPLYLKNVNIDEHSEIYKNLADKFFGNDLDQSQHDKVGDLIKDQLTAGTELIKASVELIKVKDALPPK